MQVLELRRITTHERLRANHIEVLETLQITVNENNELREKIQRLESQEAPVNDNSFSSSCLAEHALIMQRVRDQEEEINYLKESLSRERAENKTLKTSYGLKLTGMENTIHVLTGKSLYFSVKLTSLLGNEVE